MIITTEKKHLHEVTAKLSAYAWHNIFDNNFDTDTLKLDEIKGKKLDEVNREQLPVHYSEAIAILMVLYPEASAREILNKVLERKPGNGSLQTFMPQVILFLTMGNHKAVETMIKEEPTLFVNYLSNDVSGEQNQVTLFRHVTFSNNLEFIKYFIALYFMESEELLYYKLTNNYGEYYYLLAKFVDIEIFAWVFTFFKTMDLPYTAPAFVKILSRFPQKIDTNINRTDLIDQCVKNCIGKKFKNLKILVLLCFLDKELNQIEYLQLDNDDCDALKSNLKAAIEAQSANEEVLHIANPTIKNPLYYDLTEATGLLNAWEKLVSYNTNCESLYDASIVRSLINIYSCSVLPEISRIRIMRILHFMAVYCENKTPAERRSVFKSEKNYEHFKNLLVPFHSLQLCYREKCKIDKKPTPSRSLLQIVGFYYIKSTVSLRIQDEEEQDNEKTCTNTQ